MTPDNRRGRGPDAGPPIRLGSGGRGGFDVGMRGPGPIAAAAAGLLLCGGARAQGLQSLSRSMQNALAPERYGVFLASLVDLSRENELAASRYHLEGGVDTDVELLSLPFQTTLATSPDQRFLVEGSLSYLVAEADIADLFEGTLPGLETNARSEWQVATASVGAGPLLPVDEHFRVAPIGSFGLSHIRNETLLAGPGAAAARGALDDVLFDYNASTMLLGASLRAEGNFDVGHDYGLKVVARYDVTHVESLHAVNALQEFDTEVQKATAMATIQGPTTWSIDDRPLVWHADLGGRRFFGRARDVLGVDQMWELGAGLELDTHDWLGPVAKVHVSGTVVFAHDVQGYSIGFGISF